MQIKRKNIKGLDNKGISLKYRKQKRAPEGCSFLFVGAEGVEPPTLCL